MAGGVADALRTPQETLSVPTVEGRPTPLGVPLSLLAGSIFLTTGGPARIAEALALHAVGDDPARAAAIHLRDGIGLAVAVGGPLLAAQVVLDVAGALVARAAAPAQVHALLAPIRAVGLLAVLGVVLDRVVDVLAVAVR
jgi:hypothetical protein